MKRIKSLIVFVVSRTDSCVSVRMSAQYLIRVILFIGFHIGVAYSDGNNNNNVSILNTFYRSTSITVAGYIKKNKYIVFKI